MAYTTKADIRLLTNLTTSDISDADLDLIINKTTSKINAKINIKVIRELVEYIDSTRENTQDSSNTTFYIKNWNGKYLGDMDNDGDVGIEDVRVYQVDTDNLETELVVSSVTCDQGKFVLSTAPSSDSNLYITYAYSSFDQEEPDALLNTAATYLAAAYSYLKKDAGVASKVKFGNTTIERKLSESFGSYYDMYKEVLRDLNSITTTGGKFADSTVRI